MKVGAEPKKIAILAALLLAAAVIFYMNVLSTPGPGDYESSAPAAAPSATPVPPGGVASAPDPSAPATAQRRTRQSNEFRPSLRPRRGEARPDPSTIDPTLRLDLLAKLQSVDVEGARRSIFDFAAAPAPKPDPVKTAAARPPVPSPIVPIQPAQPAEQPAEPPKPAAPPIPLKFYGYVNPAAGQARRAFFTEGEEIHVVNEGDLVKKRYRIVRIGVNSVVVEDTQFGSQQTLPLEEQQG